MQLTYTSDWQDTGEGTSELTIGGYIACVVPAYLGNYEWEIWDGTEAIDHGYELTEQQAQARAERAITANREYLDRPAIRAHQARKAASARTTPVHPAAAEYLGRLLG